MITKPLLVLGCLFLFTVQVLFGQDNTPSPNFVYKEDQKRFVGIFRRGLIYIGHLDPSGNFGPDWNYPPSRLPISGYPLYELINLPRGLQEAVYEYRSGFLIKGLLLGNGDFMPEEGSKVISFKKDYRYSIEALRIYNLPGSFVKISPEK